MVVGGGEKQNEGKGLLKKMDSEPSGLERGENSLGRIHGISHRL